MSKSVSFLILLYTTLKVGLGGLSDSASELPPLERSQIATLISLESRLLGNVLILSKYAQNNMLEFPFCVIWQVVMKL